MTYGAPITAPDDTWLAAICLQGKPRVAGAGVVIGPRLILTCHHIVAPHARSSLRVRFPKAEGAASAAVEVLRVESPLEPEINDVALLYLAAPVPPGATPAPLRHPKPRDLVGRQWWAFGFAGGDPIGGSVHGRFSDALAYGWVSLDAESKERLRPGFSGSAIWAPDYSAVVGIVSQARDDGAGRALTIDRCCVLLPDAGLDRLTEWSLASSDDIALAAWGWSLATDPEAGRHWRPRARGVSVDSERGYRFRGRREALQAVKRWLVLDPPPRKALVITGSPGVGKSAVLGRIVTTADADVTAALPTGDDAVRADEGSVACAVHVKGKTALDVAMELARAASAPIPEKTEDLLPGLRAALDGGAAAGRPFNIVLDALDESVSATDTRLILSKIVLPLVETCTDLGVRVVVGTRERDNQGDVITAFGAAREIVDLDTPAYFALTDLEAYALATLQLEGDRRDDNPYDDDAIAGPFARAIARKSDANFLVAGLVARAHGLHDTVAMSPDELAFTPTVDAVLTEYLERIPPVDGLTAGELLSGLALAEAPGLTLDLWRRVVERVMGQPLTAGGLREFAHGSAANFLVEQGIEQRTEQGVEPGRYQNAVTHRLYHQALNDSLIRSREALGHERRDDEQAYADVLLAVARGQGWEKAPPYVSRSLVGHAERAGSAASMLADVDVLLHTELRRVASTAIRDSSEVGAACLRLIRLTPPAWTADADERRAAFSVTQSLERLPFDFGTTEGSGPYCAVWAASRRRPEQEVLRNEGAAPVVSMALVDIRGETFLAVGSRDGTIGLWDLVSATRDRVIAAHEGSVTTLCAVPMSGHTLLSSGGADATVKVWDPATGECLHSFTGHAGVVKSVISVVAAGRKMIASAGRGPTVHFWDPVYGKERLTLDVGAHVTHQLATLNGAGRAMLVTASGERAQAWDLDTLTELGWLEPPRGDKDKDPPGEDSPRLMYSGVAGVRTGRGEFAALQRSDGNVDIWTPLRKRPTRSFYTHGDLSAVVNASTDGHALVATTGSSSDIRIWDTASGDRLHTLRGHTDEVSHLYGYELAGRTTLVSAAGGSIRTWNPLPVDDDLDEDLHSGVVNDVCVVPGGDVTFLASAGGDGTVRIWDAADGTLLGVLEGHHGRVLSVIDVPHQGSPMVASTGSDGTIRCWSPVQGRCMQVLHSRAGPVNRCLAASVHGVPSLISVGDDGRVRVWDLARGEQRSGVRPAREPLTALAKLEFSTGPLLAVAGRGGRVHLVDPQLKKMLRVLGGAAEPGVAPEESALNHMLPIRVGSRRLVASAGADSRIRLWDAHGEQAVMTGHEGPVNALQPLTAGHRSLLLSTGNDRTLRVWDPAVGRCLLTIPVHHRGRAIAAFGDTVFLGLTSGVLALRLNTDGLQRMAGGA